jgi:hypothetical protein
MREIYRNPVLYYLLIPALVGMWPLLVWGVHLPEAQRSAETERNLYIKGQNHIIDILQLDPERLKFADVNEVSGEFSYVSAVERVANLCRIPAGGWKYNAGNVVTINSKRRQDAKVKITDVSIVQAARFLSTMQSMWVNLTCEKVKLTRHKGMADQWNVDYSFVYYY